MVPSTAMSFCCAQLARVQELFDLLQKSSLSYLFYRNIVCKHQVLRPNYFLLSDMFPQAYFASQMRTDMSSVVMSLLAVSKVL